MRPRLPSRVQSIQLPFCIDSFGSITIGSKSLVEIIELCLFDFIL